MRHAISYQLPLRMKSLGYNSSPCPDNLYVIVPTSHRLAGVRTAMAAGDPLLKSSEGVMRLMAAAVMSMAKAQRY